MGDDGKGTVAGTTRGGVAGVHAPKHQPKALVGPTTGVEFNTLAPGLFGLGCVRIDDVCFDYASSFVSADLDEDTQDIRAELALLAKHLKLFPGAVLTLFGHADANGSYEDRKQPSGRLATVIYALLIFRTDRKHAVDLWAGVAKAESWGKPQLQAMQDFTKSGSTTIDNTLIDAYLDKLVPPDIKLSKSDFLGQGADAHGKRDYQGCSCFNPSLILSKQKEDDFARRHDHKGRYDANAPNRRVLILIMPKGSKVDPKLWPCPSVKEPTAACITRLWSNAETERKARLPDKDRVSETDVKNFGCRFYDRFFLKSPCEKPFQTIAIRLFDAQARPVPFAPCLIEVSGIPIYGARAKGRPPATPGVTVVGKPGTVAKDDEDGLLLIRVDAIPSIIKIRWSRAKKSEKVDSPLPAPDDPFDYEFEMDVAVAFTDPETSTTPLARLKNLGYDTTPPKPIPELGPPIAAFQKDYKAAFGTIVADGTLNSATLDALKTSHDDGLPVLKAGSDLAMKR